MIFKRTCLIMQYLDVWVQSYIGNIRAAYTKDFTNVDITKQQIAVATYFIDKLALRAGNEKVKEIPLSYFFSLPLSSENYLGICKSNIVAYHLHFLRMMNKKLIQLVVVH